MYFRLMFVLACVAAAGCRPAMPVAAFSVTDTECSSFCPVRFVNESEGENLFFVWNFGDGTVISNETSPAHTYLRGGEYTVTLSASNERGTARSTQTIQVRIFPDSLRIAGAQITTLAACSDSPAVSYVLETEAGDTLARSGVIAKLLCSSLPANIPTGVSTYGTTSKDVFFTLWGGGSILFDQRIQPDMIQWSAGVSGEAPLNGTIVLKSPSSTGTTATISLSFLGKYR